MIHGRCGVQPGQLLFLWCVIVSVHPKNQSSETLSEVSDFQGSDGRTI